MTERVPAHVFPPGDYIRDELNARGWCRWKLRADLGLDWLRFEYLMCGAFAVTPKIANELGKVFGNSAQFWLSLQTAWETGKPVIPTVKQ